MNKAKCLECKYEQQAENLNEARRLATLHIRLTSCIMCFGE